MDIDVVRSRETGKTFRPTSWRRNARKKFVQGIHDRFIRDETFRNRMIENGRDEDFCRQWEALIPTIWPHKNIIIARVIGGFIQTRQVPILCQWSTDLTSNKHCLPYSNWKRKKHEFSKKSTMGTEFFFFFMVELARFMVDSLFPWKSRWRWTKYWQNSVTCCRSVWNTSSGHDFLEFNHFYRWIVDSLRRSTATDGVCEYNTSNDVFSRCKSVQEFGYREKVTITEDSLTTSWNWEQVSRWNWDQDEIGTKSGKFRIGHDCVVTLHDANTNDKMTIFTDFHIVWAWARTVPFLLVC